MLTARRSSTSKKRDILLTAAAVISGFLITAILLLIFSFIMTKIDISGNVARLMSVAALGVGTYFGGYICAKKRRSKGIFRGAICGFVMFIIIFVIGCFFADTVISFSNTAKLLLAVVCGSIGGIIGANSKFKRY